jgi:CHASE2 domain-containing sensor protein
VACLAVLVAYDGAHGISAMLDGVSFQLNRSSQHSVWVLTGLQSARPAALAGLVVLLGVATWHAWRHGLDDPRRLAAVSAALLIVVQLCGAYWSAAYAAWWFPLALIALFAVRTEPGPPRRGSSR